VIGFQFQRNVVEQKRCKRFCCFLLRRSSHLLLVFFPPSVSHGNNPPCSDPQSGGTLLEIVKFLGSLTDQRTSEECPPELRRREGLGTHETIFTMKRMKGPRLCVAIG